MRMLSGFVRAATSLSQAWTCGFFIAESSSDIFGMGYVGFIVVRRRL